MTVNIAELLGQRISPGRAHILVFALRTWEAGGVGLISGLRGCESFPSLTSS